MRILYAILPALALLLPQMGSARPPTRDVLVGESKIPGWWVTLEVGQRLRRVSYHSAPSQEQVAETRAEVVDALAQEALLALEAERRGLHPDAEAVARKREALVSALGGQEKVPVLLQAVGGGADGLDARARRQAAAAALIDALIREAGPITVADAKAHYASNPDGYVMADSLQLRAVLVKLDPSRIMEPEQRPATEARAREIAAALKSGAPLKALGRRYPRDAFQDLGWVHGGALKPVLAQAAETLSPGQVSDPVPTTMGYYVLHAVARREGGRLGFELVKDSIIASLEKDRRERLESEQAILARQRWPVVDPGRL